MRDKFIRKLAIVGLAAIFLLSMSLNSPAKKGGNGKKGKGVRAEICMTLEAGDLGTGLACHIQGIRPNTTQLIVRPFVFDLNYFRGELFKELFYGDDCFKDVIEESDNITLAVVKESDGTAWARVYFWAYVNDGETELKYGLHMYGDFDSPWPPENGGTTVISLNSWEMVSEGKGKLRRVSCTGSGEFPNGVTITVTREDL